MAALPEVEPILAMIMNKTQETRIKTDKKRGAATQKMKIHERSLLQQHQLISLTVITANGLECNVLRKQDFRHQSNKYQI